MWEVRWFSERDDIPIGGPVLCCSLPSQHRLRCVHRRFSSLSWAYTTLRSLPSFVFPLPHTRTYPSYIRALSVSISTPPPIRLISPQEYYAQSTSTYAIPFLFFAFSFLCFPLRVCFLIGPCARVDVRLSRSTYTASSCLSRPPVRSSLLPLSLRPCVSFSSSRLTPTQLKTRCAPSLLPPSASASASLPHLTSTSTSSSSLRPFNSNLSLTPVTSLVRQPCPISRPRPRGICVCMYARRLRRCALHVHVQG